MEDSVPVRSSMLYLASLFCRVVGKLEERGLVEMLREAYY